MHRRTIQPNEYSSKVIDSLFDIFCMVSRVFRDGKVAKRLYFIVPILLYLSLFDSGLEMALSLSGMEISLLQLLRVPGCP